MTSIGEWLEQSADLPRSERELLLKEVAGLAPARVLAFPETALPEAHQASLQAAVDQLRNGTPLAYILGEQPFWDLVLEVSPAVLIPRPETELLVELVLEFAPAAAKVLDLGTGSGAIAISVARTRKDLQVTAIDRSSAALAVAHRNAERHGTNVTFTHSDWFAELSGHWQVIVCNPPYIAEGDPHLTALTAEPSQALIAGPAGLDDLQQVITDAPQYLHTGGYLIVEHGYDQAAAVRALMQRAGLQDVRSVKDLANIERATLGCWHG